MGLSDNWTKLPANLKFVNNENSHKISTKAGVYAWYLPLRLKRDDRSPYELLERLMPYVNYFSKDKRINEYKFGWEVLDVSIGRKSIFTGQPSQKKNEAWQRICSNEVSLELFRKILLSSTIYSTPLYVGLASNLAVRYNQHINGFSSKRNTFHKRFKDFSSTLDENCQLSLQDLYFSYIEVDLSDHNLEILQMLEDSGDSDEAEGDLINVIEDVLKFIIKPGFGDK